MLSSSETPSESTTLVPDSTHAGSAVDVPKEEELKPQPPLAATTNPVTGPPDPNVESNVSSFSRSKASVPITLDKEVKAAPSTRLVESVFTGKTCMQCRVAKVKCDKHQPCDRCCRRGYDCSAQARGPGRPPASEVKKNSGSTLSETPEVSATTGRGKRKKVPKTSGRTASSKSKGRKGDTVKNTNESEHLTYPPPYGMGQHSNAPLHMRQHPGMPPPGIVGHPGFPGHPSMVVPPGFPGHGMPHGMPHSSMGGHSVFPDVASNFPPPGFMGSLPPQPPGQIGQMPLGQIGHMPLGHVGQMQQMHPSFGSYWQPGYDMMGMPLTMPLEQPDVVTNKFFNLLTSDVYTAEKKQAVVSMMKYLGLERSSGLLCRFVLQAVSLDPNITIGDELNDVRRIANSFNFGRFFFPAHPNILDGIPATAAPEDIPSSTINDDSNPNPNDCKPQDFITSWLKDIDGDEMVACRLTWEGKTTYKVSKSFGETFFDENLAKRCYCIGQDPWFNLMTTHEDENFQSASDASAYTNPFQKATLFEKALGCIITEPPLKMDFQKQTKLTTSTGHQIQVLLKVRSQLSKDGRGLWQVMKLVMNPEQALSTTDDAPKKPPSLYPMPATPFGYSQNPGTEIMSVNARVVLKAADLLVQNNIGDLLELCTEDVFIDSGKVDPVVSILGTYIGKKQVANFCDLFHSAFIVHSFHLSNFQPFGNVVKVTSDYEFTSKINSVRSKVPHKTLMRWMFNDDGKISGIFFEVSSVEWTPYFQTSHTSNPLVKDIAGLGTALLSSNDDDNVKLKPRGQRESARDWKATLEMFTRPSRTLAGSAIANSIEATVPSSVAEGSPQDEEASSVGSSGGLSLLDGISGLTPLPGSSPLSIGSLGCPPGNKS